LGKSPQKSKKGEDYTQYCPKRNFGFKKNKKVYYVRGKINNRFINIKTNKIMLFGESVGSSRKGLPCIAFRK